MLMLLALLAADPVAGPIKAFGDWVVACDNVHACEMTSLMPGDGVDSPGDEYAATQLSIARAPGPAGGFEVELGFNVPNAGRHVIQVDATIVASGTPRGDRLVFGGAEAARIVAAIVKGKELTVGDSADTLVGRVSLAGSSAALRFIDAEQGRAGSVTAAVAKGSKPAGAVPAAAARPTVGFVRPSGATVKITSALKQAMGRLSDCQSEFTDGLPDVTAWAIGGGKTLALLPCGAGAYNYLTVPFVIAAGKPAVAAFDYAPGMTEKGSAPMLVNADWDAKTARLSSYSKGRGVGDCGSAEEYVWDGARFRLVEARAMIECRGSVNWLTIWTATAVVQ